MYLRRVELNLILVTNQAVLYKAKDWRQKVIMNWENGNYYDSSYDLKRSTFNFSCYMKRVLS